MKRIFFLIALSLIFISQSAYSSSNNYRGVCQRYFMDQCAEYKYCRSMTMNGCNNYETCTLEGEQYACVSDDSPNNNKIYRSKDFVESKIQNVRKQTYTSPIVEKYQKLPLNDNYFPSEENSRYAPINQDSDIYKTYYNPKDAPYTLDETLPRRDVWTGPLVPYPQVFYKYKYPKRRSTSGVWNYKF